MKFLCIVLLLIPPLAIAQTAPAGGQTLAVFPFENGSTAPGLSWISESFPQILKQRLASQFLYVVGREDRLKAYDRASIPAHIHPTRATLYHIAEQMDVDWLVLGKFTYDGRVFQATAQLLDMRRQKLLPAVNASGPLVELIDIETGLAWELLRQLRPDLPVSRPAYVAAAPQIRLNAFEHYVRGIIAVSPPEKIDHFRNAVRINPSYFEAWLALGTTYYGERQYDQAVAALNHIPEDLPEATEAHFYTGLAQYYKGEFARAEAAFEFASGRLPLTEVFNNLGVVIARQSKKEAAQYFQQAVRNDPNDADYHFNYGVTLYRAGDPNGAARQLKEGLNIRPGDSEAKAFYDRVNAELSTRASPAPPTAAARVPLERIKRNYDESSFRQLALQLQAFAEQRLAKTDPRSHARFHVGRGGDLLAQGFVSEAEREFREAVSLDPANPQAHSGLARVLEVSGDLAAARSEAQAAIRLRLFAEPYLVLARLDLKDNKTDAALESINRALQLEPTNPAAQALKRDAAARLAQKAQPLQSP